MSGAQAARGRPSADSSSDRNGAATTAAFSARESACRSLRILLPILALYTLFSLAWTTPIASVLHSVSSGTSVKRRTPKAELEHASLDQSTVTSTTTTTTTTSTDSNNNNNPVTDRTPSEQQQQQQQQQQQAQPQAQPQDQLQRTQQDQQEQVSDAETPSTKSSAGSTNPPPSKATATNSVATSTTTSTTATTPTSMMANDNDDNGPVIRPASNRRKAYKLEPPACMRGTGRAKTFLMVFMGHSGSTAIMSELKSHPQMFIEKWEPVDHGDIRENTTAALEYTREFFKRGIAEGKTPGFKIRPLHIKNDPKAWAALAREFDTRIVWQYRRNALKQAVGEYSYRVLKDNSILEGLRSEDEVKNRCDIGAGCSFAIENFAEFHKILNAVTRSDYQIAEAAHLISDGRDCVHEMRYEDYLYHRKGAMLDLLEFLGADLVETQPERYKATRDNLCDVVTNWNDVCGAFYGCKVWRHMFEDGENGCSCRFSSSPAEFCETPSHL